MRLKRVMSFALAAAMAAGLTACGGASPEKTETTEVKDTAAKEKSEADSEQADGPLEFTCRLRDGEYSPAEIQLYQELEQETGVKINWTTYADSAWAEKKSLLFASNQLPEAFFGQEILSNDDLLKYGPEGMLIPLESYITEENTPNLYKIFQDYPEYKRSITAPDGHIYSLMSFDDGYVTTTNLPLFINKDWLENVNMAVPTTTDEFYEVLKAFKEQDANGNGDPDDEIPYSFNKDTNYASDLFGSFGMIDDTRIDSGKTHIAVKDGKVIYTAVGEEYKNAIKYFHKLYSEGLIDQEAFTQDNSVFKAKCKNENRTVGVLQGWRSTAWSTSNEDDSYIPVPPLTGPDGDRYWPELQNGVNGLGSFAITNVARDPEYIMRWVDHCYDPLFSVQASLALKVGLHLKEDGNGKYDYAEAPTTENRAKVVPGGYDRIYSVTKEAAALLKGAPSHMIEKQTLDTYYSDYYYPEYYPKFMLSTEESDRLSTLATEINSFANEKYAAWMTGGGIDEEWDSYLKQMNTMGLPELVEIYQGALDRYHAGK